jgi:hypothetical protein
MVSASNRYETVSSDNVNESTQHAFSIESLINRVDEIQRREQLETIQQLTLDNTLLQQLIINYQDQWCCTIDLLERSQEAVLLLQKAIEHSIQENVIAEKQWLSFWGIEKENAKNPGYSPAGWI